MKAVGSHWGDPKAARLGELLGKVTQATRVMNAVAAVMSLLLLLGALGLVLLSWARGKVAGRAATHKGDVGASASVN